MSHDIVYKQLINDRDLLDLADIFIRQKAASAINTYNYDIEDHSAVNITDLDAVIDYVALSIEKVDLSNTAIDSKTVEKICSLVKYFYLLANILLIVCDQLLNKKELTLDNRVLFYAAKGIEIKVSSFGLSFGVYLETGDIKDINLYVAAPSNINRNFNLNELLVAGVTWRASKTSLAQFETKQVSISDINKTLYQNLLDKLLLHIVK